MSLIKEYLDDQVAIMIQNYNALAAEGRTTIYLREVVAGTFLEKTYSDEEKACYGWTVKEED